MEQSDGRRYRRRQRQYVNVVKLKKVAAMMPFYGQQERRMQTAAPYFSLTFMPRRRRRRIDVNDSRLK